MGFTYSILCNRTTAGDFPRGGRHMCGLVALTNQWGGQDVVCPVSVLFLATCAVHIAVLQWVTR